MLIDLTIYIAHISINLLLIFSLKRENKWFLLVIFAGNKYKIIVSNWYPVIEAVETF